MYFDLFWYMCSMYLYDSIVSYKTFSKSNIKYHLICDIVCNFIQDSMQYSFMYDNTANFIEYHMLMQYESKCCNMGSIQSIQIVSHPHDMWTIKSNIHDWRNGAAVGQSCLSFHRYYMSSCLEEREMIYIYIFYLYDVSCSKLN